MLGTAAGYAFELATIGDSVVVGGADVPFSNNGPLSNVSHTSGTTTVTVNTAGTYYVEFGVSITAGIGSAVAIAVNGAVQTSTVNPALVATGAISGSALLTLAAGDVVTLRNHSATPFVLTLAPSVGARLVIYRVQ